LSEVQPEPMLIDIVSTQPLSAISPCGSAREHPVSHDQQQHILPEPRVELPAEEADQLIRSLPAVASSVIPNTNPQLPPLQRTPVQPLASIRSPPAPPTFAPGRGPLPSPSSLQTPKRKLADAFPEASVDDERKKTPRLAFPNPVVSVTATEGVSF